MMIENRALEAENEILRWANKKQKVLIYDIYKYLVGETDNKEELIERIKELRR